MEDSPITSAGPSTTASATASNDRFSPVRRIDDFKYISGSVIVYSRTMNEYFNVLNGEYEKWLMGNKSQELYTINLEHPAALGMFLYDGQMEVAKMSEALSSNGLRDVSVTVRWNGVYDAWQVSHYDTELTIEFVKELLGEFPGAVSCVPSQPYVGLIRIGTAEFHSNSWSLA